MAVILDHMQNGDFMKWLLAIAVVVAAVGSRDIASVISPDQTLEQQIRILEQKLEQCR